MSLLDNITPLLLTYNEEANIDRTLRKLQWAETVIVVDSGSEDRTKTICGNYGNVRFIYRKFDCHAKQWNFGLNNTGISTEWVLALDADYVLTEEFIDELKTLKPSSECGFRSKFKYCVNGKPLSGSLYPPVVTLYRKSKAHYVQDGHTQRVVVDGRVVDLESYIYHDDRKSLDKWLMSQNKYAQLECDLLRRKKFAELRWQDRMRKLIFVTPWLVPIYCITIGKGFKDGWYGVFYAFQRGIAETILSLKLLEAKINKVK
ncbi:MAG: glycosyltransferase family 2 protein [Gammaproteobacteria bacterium]|nr:glycosyltransferase family 2 protein [Gammaproteobacteria bacterium]MDH5799269.1 glycosyltransferase family 2 protein [Gammaproteobacteria bacterium]